MIIHDIQKIISLLKKEEIAAIPTETVYGLAGIATSYKAVSKIYKLKNRPAFNPLIVHVSNVEQIHTFAELSLEQITCLEYFWNHEQPLTIVLRLKNNHQITPLVTAGLSTIAVRKPHHPLAIEIIKQTGPLAAPSANTSNKLSPTKAEHVESSFGENAPLILDGGECLIGLESTILHLVDIKKPILLRAGGVSLEKLEAFFKQTISLHTEKKIQAPGQLKHHYSPGCPLKMNTTTIEDGEVLLGFGENAPPYTTLNLSQKGHLDEAAHNLFHALYQLSLLKPKAIAVMPIPKTGIGLAINDRLERAAAKND